MLNMLPMGLRIKLALSCLIARKPRTHVPRRLVHLEPRRRSRPLPVGSLTINGSASIGRAAITAAAQS